MPLLTPVSSASSRDDDVIIIRANREECPMVEGAGLINEGRMKDRILILGPFLPQTLSLSSSDSSESGPPPRHTFPTISIPYPSYDDCFAAPAPPGSDLFNPIEYESSVFSIDDDSLDDSDESSSVSPLTPWVDYENEHRHTVKTRLEALEELISSVHSESNQLKDPIPGLGYQSPLTPDHSTVGTVARVHDPFGDNLIDDTGTFQEIKVSYTDPTTTGAQKKSYKIPQLRDVLFCDGSTLPEDSDSDSHCHACHALAPPRSMVRVIPCHDCICKRCFSAALGAVSKINPISRCPACLRPTTAYTKLDHRAKQSIHEAVTSVEGQERLGLGQKPDGPFVMRIDNVAWDLTPEVVQEFLPKGSLADISVPIHIPLNRYDGRTKDYMYIEVASREAACTILQTCQNALMPGGPLTAPRKRAVTITQVHHSELLRELRPHSASELHGLLSLCQASVSGIQPPSNHTSSYVAPNGIAHFVKNRHGPFNALMSILSKVKGKDSPVYWDLFHVTSGAIAALASHISRTLDPAIISQQHDSYHDPDRMMLKGLKGMFESVFSLKLESGRLSPI